MTMVLVLLGILTFIPALLSVMVLDSSENNPVNIAFFYSVFRFRSYAVGLVWRLGRSSLRNSIGGRVLSPFFLF